MKRRLVLAGLMAIALCVAMPLAQAQRPAGVKVREDLYVVSVYDAKRDPAADLKLAISKAQAENKRILLDIGGDWCVWCHILDDYLGRNKSVGDAFAASFVVLKIQWSLDHRNEAFLAAYPEAEGYPHFYILDASGAYLGQQPTGDLERGDSYNRMKMLAFAEKWRIK
jgi:thiol:disulfide interchange protein